ncbi:MAG: hypothetical protein LBC41_11070, partial [Clostridiales bacterium]|nr:hypothetical protein [Clostridiales bacterium]
MQRKRLLRGISGTLAVLMSIVLCLTSLAWRHSAEIDNVLDSAARNAEAVDNADTGEIYYKT